MVCGVDFSPSGIFKMHCIGCYPGERPFRCFSLFANGVNIDFCFISSFLFTRPLYPECVLESRPPSSRDPGQWDIWSDRAWTRQADADPARPLWGGALGSGPAPQEATGCDRQWWPLCQVRPQQWWLSSPRLPWDNRFILPKFACYCRER